MWLVSFVVMLGFAILIGYENHPSALGIIYVVYSIYSCSRFINLEGEDVFCHRCGYFYHVAFWWEHDDACK